MTFGRIGPDAYARKQAQGELADTLTIDVRQPEEWEYYHWEEMELCPMMTIPEKLEELPKDKPLYVVCAHGVRSEHVCRYLSERGFDNAVNVEGGMAALAAVRGFRYD
ncbi:Rhodanese-related sulfurtransferase [Paenibacillus sp. UNCCL117]|uniref:rhodanese-like domain-containing protein n=1 Tax=unclassified Paenibacillus TaxID=185978 RepID=UPI0008826350|nr:MULTISPECIES: rhodanese-like domain-containing protein [unclassified Paenibacillus]SDC39252.1 Rhodanese-related sulfurtransferase [Paenibacillus sp. cl123]SFW14156.1 Rhodanese-related sulfurtransferase [Paenibacillus sp. UNCCL117]